MVFSTQVVILKSLLLREFYSVLPALDIPYPAGSAVRKHVGNDDGDADRDHDDSESTTSSNSEFNINPSIPWNSSSSSLNSKLVADFVI